MKPPIPITDARFCYVPSHKTEIRDTFERVRKQFDAGGGNAESLPSGERSSDTVKTNSMHSSPASPIENGSAELQLWSSLAAATLIAQQREGK